MTLYDLIWRLIVLLLDRKKDRKDNESQGTDKE